MSTVEDTPESAQGARPTYPQHWRSYNSAQIWEKQNVAQMLSEICEGIHAPCSVAVARARCVTLSFAPL